MILTRTPYRISLFGGGTDYLDWLKDNNGFVLGTAINRYCYVGIKHMPAGQMMRVNGIEVPLMYRVQYSKVDDCEHRDQIAHPAVRGALNYFDIDQPLEFHCFGDLPGRSGMGGSGAFTVGLVNALSGMGLGVCSSPMELAMIATDIELEVVKEAVGFQDQLFSACGGINAISFEGTDPSDAKVIPLKHMIPAEIQEQLMGSLRLVYTGIMRDANTMAQMQIDNIPHNTGVLTDMAELAKDACKLLTERGKVDDIGKMLDQTWEMKRSLAKEISSPDIDELYAHGLRCGATGGKLLGAGGGGYMLFYVPVDNWNRFDSNIEHPMIKGLNIAEEGSKIIVNEPSF